MAETESRLQALLDHRSQQNQCDGCQRGLPVEKGIHYGPGHKEGTAYDYIGCTAEHYHGVRMWVAYRCDRDDGEEIMMVFATRASAFRWLHRSESESYLEQRPAEEGVDFGRIRGLSWDYEVRLVPLGCPHGYDSTKCSVCR